MRGDDSHSSAISSLSGGSQADNAVEIPRDNNDSSNTNNDSKAAATNTNNNEETTPPPPTLTKATSTTSTSESQLKMSSNNNTTTRHDFHSQNTLDMRHFTKLEDAIMTVKSFLEETRDTYLDQFSYNPSNYEGKECYCTILTASNNHNPNSGLRTVLQKIFTNRQITFVIRNDGREYDEFMVDVLTGRDADEALERRRVEQFELEGIAERGGGFGNVGGGGGGGLTSAQLEMQYQQHLMNQRAAAAAAAAAVGQGISGGGVSNNNSYSYPSSSAAAARGGDLGAMRMMQPQIIEGNDGRYQQYLEQQRSAIAQSVGQQQLQIESNEGRYQQYLEQQRAAVAHDAVRSTSSSAHRGTLPSAISPTMGMVQVAQQSAVRSFGTTSSSGVPSTAAAMAMGGGVRGNTTSIPSITETLLQEQYQRNQDAMIAELNNNAELNNYYPVAKKKSPEHMNHVDVGASSSSGASPFAGVESRYLQQRLLLQQQQQQQLQQRHVSELQQQQRRYVSDQQQQYPVEQQYQQRPSVATASTTAGVAAAPTITTSSNNSSSAAYLINGGTERQQSSSPLIPQDQGAGMLYNPFDSIQPMGSLLDTMPFSELCVAAIARGTSGGSGAGSEGLGDLSFDVKLPPVVASITPPEEMATQASDDAFRALIRSDLSPGEGIDSPGIGGDVGGGGEGDSRVRLPVVQSSNDAIRYERPVPLRPQQPQQQQQRSLPVAHRNGNMIAPASTAAPSRHQHQHRVNTDINEVDIRRVITESQAAHAAHTRRQVDDDIQFRRALEAAAMQSRNEDEGGRRRQQQQQQQQRQPQSSQQIPNDDSEFESQLERAIADSQRISHRRHEGPVQSSSLGVQQPPDGEDDLVRMISEQSIRDEEQRQRAAQEKYQVEMEMALKLSERLEEENKRIESSEEELLQQILEQTRREQEEAQVAEQQLMQRVIRESVATAEGDGDPQYNELMQRVIRESVASAEGDGVNDEMLEEVLKLSLEEEKQEKQLLASTAEEEAEQMRMAMEWSMYDFECEREDFNDRKRQGT